MKNLLFPRVFQVIGWVLFVPAIVIGILIYINAFDYDDSLGIDLPTGIMETVLNDAVIIGIALGAIFIVCSKERLEDEMTRSIRLASLLNSLYIYVGLLVMTTLFINGMNFYWVMVLNLVILPVIYVVTFRLEMHRYYKISDEDEE